MKNSMTQEEIQTKAEGRYYLPEEYNDSDGLKTIKYGILCARCGYMDALNEIETLPKFEGWVARDKNSGRVYLHQSKPKRNEFYGIWGESCDYCVLASFSVDEFPELTWDSEPRKVELLVREKQLNDLP